LAGFAFAPPMMTLSDSDVLKAKICRAEQMPTEKSDFTTAWKDLTETELKLTSASMIFFGNTHSSGLGPKRSEENEDQESI
jgi:hypothetical protein